MAVFSQLGSRPVNSTLTFRTPARLVATAAVVGPMEGKGPLGDLFHVVTQDDLLKEKSWERAESRMLEEAVRLAVDRSGLDLSSVELLLAGDLLNQIVASNFAARAFDFPFMGLYGACATCAMGLGLAGALVEGKYRRVVVTGASSHNKGAERQYRYPTEFGAQRPPTAQWTVTGAGAFLVTDEATVKSLRNKASERPVSITHATIGRVVDPGLKDPYDMGSAMAPAAADTILAHLRDTERSTDDYDLIATGDLGSLGRQLCLDLLEQSGEDMGERLQDCGLMIYSTEQDVHAGASGCACSAVVLGTYLWNELQSGALRRILLVSTGALHSPVSYKQGESIPGIAHAVALERAGG